ncbi:MAG: hypothetical protein ACK5Y2_14025 [Bdellovibrionales bacterium]
MAKAPMSEWAGLQKLLMALDRPQMSYLTRQLKKLTPSQVELVRDSLSIGQVESKLWCLEMAANVLPNRAYDWWILGGWTGILIQLLEMRHSRLLRHAHLVDWDAEATQVSRLLLEYLSYTPGKIEIHTEDMMLTPSRWKSQPALIVNTSCEHLTSIAAWRSTLPAGSFLIAQNTDLVGPDDHYSRVSSLSDFLEQLQPLDDFFLGSLELPVAQRFMVMGVVGS